jgi:MarR family transcriptional regulator, lower aerobic nicotinate degradation pathway regulator
MNTSNKRPTDPAHDPEPYDVTRHPAQLVRRVHQRAAQLFNQSSPDRQLTAPQFAILATLLQSGPTSQNKLGTLVSMDPSTISAVIRKLMQDGLVCRSQSDSDRRMQFIALSDTGLVLVKAHLEISRRAGEALLRPLSTGERLIFLELLERILDDDKPDRHINTHKDESEQT